MDVNSGPIAITSAQSQKECTITRKEFGMEILEQNEIEMISAGTLAYDLGHAVGGGFYSAGSWIGGQLGNLIQSGINGRFNGSY